MKLLLTPRQSGKTTHLINEYKVEKSLKFECAIITFSCMRKQQLIKQYGLPRKDVFVIGEKKLKNLRHHRIFIDDIDCILKGLFDANSIRLMTATDIDLHIFMGLKDLK